MSICSKIGALVLAGIIASAPSYGFVERYMPEMEAEACAWERDIALPPIMQFHTWNLAQQYETDYNLVLSVMKFESNYKPTAHNTANANGTTDYGYMQINSSNVEWVNELAGRKLNLANPMDNVEAGILILEFYRGYWENKGLEGAQLRQYTVNSYNMGIGGYTSAGMPSRSYDRKIGEFYENLYSAELDK